MSSINGIRLYDYNGQYQTVSAPLLNQSFQVPSTAFSNNYQVNGNFQGVDVGALVQKNWVAGPNGTVQTQSAQAQAPVTSNTITDAGRAYNPGGANLTVQGVTQQYAGFYNAASNANNLSSLMQRGQFNIFNGSLGLQVQSNGTDITSVKILPGSYNRLTGTLPTADAFPDRTDITTRAAGKNANDVGIQSPQPIFKTGATQPVSPAAVVNAAQNAALSQVVNPIQTTPKTNLLTTANLPKFNPFDVATNPLTQALYRAQQPAVDVTVTGPAATVTPDAARQIATVNAGYSVAQSPTLQDNLTLLRQAVAQQTAQPVPSQNIQQARDGMMPVAPYVPSQPANTAPTFISTANTLQNMSAGADATDKKSAGGAYIPFAFSQSQSGAGQQDPNRRRKAMSFVA